MWLLHIYLPYIQTLLRGNLGDMDGLRIGGTVVNNLSYTDDTVIGAESEEQLQRVINIVVAKSEDKLLHMNIAKSFSMAFSKSLTDPTCHIDVHRNIMEQVQSFIYLGRLFTSMQDVTMRLEGE